MHFVAIEIQRPRGQTLLPASALFCVTASRGGFLQPVGADAAPASCGPTQRSHRHDLLSVPPLLATVLTSLAHFFFLPPFFFLAFFARGGGAGAPTPPSTPTSTATVSASMSSTVVAAAL